MCLHADAGEPSSNLNKLIEMRELYKSSRPIKYRIERQSPVWDIQKRGKVYSYVTKSIHKTFLNTPIQLVPFIQKGVNFSKSLYIEGIGSDNRVDLDGDTVMNRALYSMADQINNGTVPLRFGHRNIPLGVFEASKVSEGKLLIRAKLNEDSPAAQEILRQMNEGQQFGFSIGGDCVLRVDENGRKDIYDVTLKEISVVEVPANPRAILTALVRKHLQQKAGN